MALSLFSTTGEVDCRKAWSAGGWVSSVTGTLSCKVSTRIGWCRGGYLVCTRPRILPTVTGSASTRSGHRTLLGSLLCFSGLVSGCGLSATSHISIFGGAGPNSFSGSYVARSAIEHRHILALSLRVTAFHLARFFGAISCPAALAEYVDSAAYSQQACTGKLWGAQRVNSPVGKASHIRQRSS